MKFIDVVILVYGIAAVIGGALSIRDRRAQLSNEMSDIEFKGRLAVINGIVWVVLGVVILAGLAFGYQTLAWIGFIGTILSSTVVGIIGSVTGRGKNIKVKYK